MAPDPAWFYLDRNDEQRGPVTRAELMSLAKEGTVRPDALVWRQGFADWQAFRDVRELQKDSAAAPKVEPRVEKKPPPQTARTTAAATPARTKVPAKPRQGRGAWIGVAVAAAAVAGVVFALANRSPELPLRQASTDTVAAPEAQAEPAAQASAPEPVRIRNPFDDGEVFEFPPGTSKADAHDQVAALLRKRAEERLARRR
jgi:negative regulator of sigma E activity